MGTKKRKRIRRRRASRAFPFTFRDIIALNSCSALKDESYGVIQRCVDDMLKDPELRKIIEYHSRKILKAIAAKL